METALLITIAIIGFAVIFDFINGFHDAANIVATMISSRSISPEAAIIIASVCELIGPFVLGTAVAKTIGTGIVSPGAITNSVIFAGLFGAITWNIVTWRLGMPSSSSHALIGGLAGAVIISSGFGKLNVDGFLMIILVLITSPLIGMLAGNIIFRIVKFLTRNATPVVNGYFKRLQIFSAIGLALAHGGNDAQKTMGIITMTLVSYNHFKGTEIPFVVPVWVIIVCALAISMGTAFGGWKIIKTVGGKIYKLRPVHAFVSQASSAGVIFTAAVLGGPVSTTHVVSSSIMGVGAAERIKAVKWQTAKNIVATWFITIPASALVSFVVYGIIIGLKKVF